MLVVPTRTRSPVIPGRPALRTRILSLSRPPGILRQCDNIHRDPGSGKLFILGCFSIIGTETVPATHPLMGLYIELTNGRGNVKFKVQLVDAEEVWPPIWTSEAEINFDDPRAVAQLAFMAHNVSFERAGEYRFQLFACDEFLMERRVLLITQDQIEK